MGIVNYFKERWHLILIGFVVGFALGYLRATFLEPAELPQSGRLLMAGQIGLAFSALALFIHNYLELRKRVIKKAESLKKENNN